MKKLHPAAAAVAIAVVLAIVLRRDGYSSHGPTPRFSLFSWFSSGGSSAISRAGKAELTLAKLKAQKRTLLFGSADF
ncbi:hypothetical protein [Mesorhizobium sp. NZP2234]|uniref:hypothetical protein n=1 Tax=Mesorhizobium sp. NZP2234 TaxID=2483402 RepID=UPI0015548D4C|nr:hypothetical protein [Mesorhizobium sp. NZP2234]